MAGDDIESRGGRNSWNNKNASDSQWTLWLVPLFVVANIAVFVIVMYVNNCPEHRHTRIAGQCVARFLRRLSFEPLRENHLFGPSSATLDKLGGLEWTKVVIKHQGWRLITCMWLHAGVLHLLANMLSLLVIGIRLEQQFGFVRVAIIYLVSGLGASVLSALFIRDGISVGASGAVFGLLGAMISEVITNWTIYRKKLLHLFTLLVFIGINLALGLSPAKHVDDFAHIGGLVTGFFLGFVLLSRPQSGQFEQQNLPAGTPFKSKYKPYQYALGLVSLVLLVVGFTVALVMLFRGENGNDHCRWCRLLTCVTTARGYCDRN
ncbi:homeobox-leucine zipper protein ANTHOCYANINLESS 2-like isoform X1 [Hibiscus syriacus]|uniref:RHOMBOID-like protein n=1 Tax=Hibiscus syriacus TaxID=106335 RepID=A0A6A3C609_HIBSY|nr:RHOMBOID-like protein 3 [Hibiscus syriacus]KAE8722479.1 homeobox-leucine zipper protein ANTHOCYANINLESS 2-like isoform X1 [Hibiscus syriacus]